MITNPATRQTFQIRAKIISYIRRYFDERGFIEVRARRNVGKTKYMKYTKYTKATKYELWGIYI